MTPGRDDGGEGGTMSARGGLWPVIRKHVTRLEDGSPESMALADAVAVLPPSLTAAQREALDIVLSYVEGWNAVDRPVLRPDAQKMRDAVALLRALATGQP
jgi:hypothetical protein